MTEPLNTQSGESEDFERGLRAVMTIRCMAHRAVPQMNANEATGAECAVCAVESAVVRAGAALEAGPSPERAVPGSASLAALIGAGKAMMRALPDELVTSLPEVRAFDDLLVVVDEERTVPFDGRGEAGPSPAVDPPIYVYSSHYERLLYFPDLEKFDPLVIGPGVSIELRWVRAIPPQEKPSA